MTLNNGTVTYEKVQYNENLIARAVHLIRNPIDNVVSRYHLFLKLKSKSEELNSTASRHYTNDVDGFLRWCQERDEKYLPEEKELFGTEAFDLLKKIPCHADFYRLAMWHNHAFDVIEEMKVPSLILHYEDYASNFEQTKDQLFRFLHIEEASGGKRRIKFVGGKSYSSYYSLSQRETIFQALELLCNKKSFNEIGYYYLENTFNGST